MNEWLKKNHFLLFAIIIGSVMFIMVSIRAVISGITYDEAYTYLEYARKTIIYVFSTLFNTEGVLANNHFLNTLFISLINAFSGGQYIAGLIRLPNVLFYAIYMFFAYKLANKFKAKYLCFILLVFNYGAHEFFGLARGYGIATCFVLISIYYLKMWLEDKEKTKLLNISYILLMASAYANTVTLIVFASVFIYTVIILIKENMIIDYMKKYWYYIGIMVILGLVIIRYHFIISSDGMPLYGGKEGFFDNVIVSLCQMYGFGVLSVVIAVLSVFLYIFGIVNLKRSALKWETFYLPIICFALLIIMTIITQKIWITGRSLIPFTPLIVFGIMELYEKYKFDNNIVQGIIAVALCIPFILNFNIAETREWSDNYVIKYECYRAYSERDSEILDKYSEYPPVVKFYQEKLIKKYGYDIVIGEEMQ